MNFISLYEKNMPLLTSVIFLLSQVEKELRDICHDMFDLLDKNLIPAAASGEAKVYYYKM